MLHVVVDSANIQGKLSMVKHLRLAKIYENHKVNDLMYMVYCVNVSQGYD